MKAIIFSTLTVLAAYGFLGVNATQQGNKAIQLNLQQIQQVEQISNYEGN